MLNTTEISPWLVPFISCVQFYRDFLWSECVSERETETEKERFPLVIEY